MSRESVRSHTLRSLKLMADGKRAFHYDLAIDQTCMIGDLFNGKFNPATRNPFRGTNELPLPKKSKTNTKESQIGWKLLTDTLREIALAHPKTKRKKREEKFKKK